MIENEEILTLEQAANFLQVSRQTFYKLMKKGAIPAGRKLGGQRRFSKRELVEWVEGKHDNAA